MTGSTYIKRLLFPIIILGTLAVAGCGNNGGSTDSTTGGNPAPASTALTTVNIGYNPTIVQPQPLLGVAGEYGRLVPGVAFTGQVYQAGPAVLEALRSGKIDIACSGVYPAMKAYIKEKDIVLLCGAATGGTQLMVPKASPYKTVADLKGKAVGVNQLGSTVDAQLRYNLVQAGLVPDKDVKIIKVEPGDQANALQGGELAAVAAPAPWPSVTATKANARPLLDSKAFFNNGNYLSGSIYTTKKFADAHPDFIKSFIEANAKITERLNKDRVKGDADVYAAWSKVTKKTLPDAVAKDAFSTIIYTSDVDAKALQDFADIANKVGVLKEKADLSGFVYKQQ